MSPPCLDTRRSSDFLSNIQARTAALAAAHLRLVVALVDTCAATAPHALPCLREAYFGAGAGGHAAARILTSHVAACMRAAESGEGRATPLRAVAALAQLLVAGDVAHMHTAIALQPAAAVRSCLKPSCNRKPALSTGACSTVLCGVIKAQRRNAAGQQRWGSYIITSCAKPVQLGGTNS